jgi:hypothetical protein
MRRNLALLVLHPPVAVTNNMALYSHEILILGRGRAAVEGFNLTSKNMHVRAIENASVTLCATDLLLLSIGELMSLTSA